MRVRYTIEKRSVAYGVIELDEFQELAWQAASQAERQTMFAPQVIALTDEDDSQIYDVYVGVTEDSDDEDDGPVPDPEPTYWTTAGRTRGTGH